MHEIVRPNQLTNQRLGKVQGEITMLVNERKAAHVKKYYKVVLKSVNKITKRVVERTYLIPESALDQDVRKNLQATGESPGATVKSDAQLRFVPNVALGRHLKSTLLASLNHKALTPSQTQATVLDAFSKDNSRTVEKQFSIRKPLFQGVQEATVAVSGRARRLTSTFPVGPNYNKTLTSSHDHSRNVMTSTQALVQYRQRMPTQAVVQNRQKTSTQAVVRNQQNKVEVASRLNTQGLLIREFPLRRYYHGEDPPVDRRNNPSQTTIQNQPANAARMSQNLSHFQTETLRGVNFSLQGGHNLQARVTQNQQKSVAVQKRPQARFAPTPNQNLFALRRRDSEDTTRANRTSPVVNLKSSSATQNEEDEVVERGKRHDHPIIKKIILSSSSTFFQPTNSAQDVTLQPKSSVVRHPPDTYKCKICGQNFDTHGKLRGHRYVHRKRPYKCEHCGKSFPILSRLNVHMSIHMDEKKFPCDVCGKIYKTKSSLQLHTCTNTFMEGGFACKICSRKFFRLQSLKNHVSTVHLNVKYKCGVCHKEYRQIGSLKIHERRHDPQFVAPSLKCDVCGATFTFKAALTQHRSSVHEGKLYVCDVCGKGITSWTSFQSHLRTHTGEKPFVCETCGKAFSSRKLLIIHIRIHTKEKPYPCKLCGKRFSQLGSAKIHLLRVHRREKQFQCDICNKMFMSKAQLKAHTKSHGIPSSELGTKAKLAKSY